MRARTIGAALVLLALSACGGGTATSGPASTAGGGGGTPAPGATAGTASTPLGTAAAIDFGALDACTLVDEATVTALTGATKFLIDKHSIGASSTCFWGVAGAPQYLEVTVSQRNRSLAGYALNVNGVTCPSTALTGMGIEAVGGVCTSPQKKIYVAGMDRGIAVEVQVNEPKTPMTPQDLAATAQKVFDALP